MSFFNKSGIVNVKMVITEEKILSNIDKVQKLINPNSKKQIVQLEDDSYFKDLVESVKTYLLEYPKKKNFPKSVYKAAYDLVEYATNQFEENTKKIEDLIRQREKNIKLASVLRDATAAVKARAKNWKEIVKKLESKYPAEIAEALTVIGKSKDKESEEFVNAVKTIDPRRMVPLCTALPVQATVSKVYCHILKCQAAYQHPRTDPVSEPRSAETLLLSCV